MAEGQSANPRGSPEMRRINIVLNSRYGKEGYPVIVLDWARKHKFENGKPYSDRATITEALILLGERYGVEKPDDPDALSEPGEKTININTLANELGDRLERVLRAALKDVQFAPGTNRAEQMNQIMQKVSSGISTGNLVGHSYDWDEEEE